MKIFSEKLRPPNDGLVSQYAAELAGAHEFFRKQSTTQPLAGALWHRGHSVSYGELQDKVDRMAWYLDRMGVRESDIVGIALDVGTDLIVAMLATLECGAAFLALDPHHPPERLQSMLLDADVRLLLTHECWQSQFEPLLDVCEGHVLCVDKEAAAIAQQSCEPLRRNITGDHLAYLMYTSGSTGQPKGVEINHRALVNKISHAGAWGELNAEVRGVLLASIIFDAALAQIFFPLSHGGCVILIDHDERLQPRDLWRVLTTARATVIDATPTWLSAMLDIGLPTSNWQPRRVVLGGEALPPQLLVRLRRLWPQATLVNAYGPTETCIDSVCFEIEPHIDVAAFTRSIPIGAALPNYRLHILDAELNPVAIGQSGELCIGGYGLARGYRKRPQQTDERFIPDPFVNGERLYRTGDLVRMRKDGLLEFIGRCDDQIKISGQRIEIGEIEAVLGQSGAACNIAVALVDAKLTAFVSGANSDALDELRKFALNKLPGVMQPQRWISIAALPLTPSGKLDRKALTTVADEYREKLLSSSSALQVVDDAIEATLQQLWGEVLDIPAESIKREDNFFELGGQSLTAAMLMAKINQTFDVELGLATIFTHSALMDLALAIQRGECSGETAGLVTLSRTAGQPLFCIPPLGGVGTVYVGLARALAKHCPVYALQSIDLPDSPATIDMTALAAHFIARVRAVQPHGPYRFAGYSAGGAVALAMCERLTAQGEHISQLVLIDPYHWTDIDLQIARKKNPEEMFWQICREMLGEALDIRDAAADRVLPLAQSMWAEKLKQPHTKATNFSDAIRTHAQLVLPERIDLSVLALLIEGVHNSWSAYYGHEPKPISFPIAHLLMIQPDADEVGKREQRSSHWRALAGNNLHAVVVTGQHPTMLISAATIAAIADCIEANAPQQ